MKAEARAMLGRSQWKEKRDQNGKAGGFLTRIGGHDGTELITTVCGVGPTRSANGAGLLLREGVDGLVGAGISGGLSPDLKAGDLVLATGVIDERGTQYKASESVVDFALKVLEANSLGVRKGLIITTEKPLLDASAKKNFYNKKGALAVDMESAGMASVAVKKGAPFFIMRAVSDEAGEALSPDLYACLDEESGEIKSRQILGSCIRRPAMVKEMMGLRRPYNLALSKLGQGWKILLKEGLLSYFLL